MKKLFTVAFLFSIAFICHAVSDSEELRLKAYNCRYGIGCTQDYYISRNYNALVVFFSKFCRFGRGVT